MENVRVIVKIKPILSSEQRHKEPSCLDISEDGKVITVRTTPVHVNKYKCRKCFAPTVLPRVFFNQSGIPNLLEKGLRGNNISIFAFGHTGSGKTFSLVGCQRGPNNRDKQSGILTHSAEYLFNALETSGIKYELKFCCFELYQEKLYDICGSSDVQLKVVGTTVQGCTMVRCESYVYLLDLIAKCWRTRQQFNEDVQSRNNRSHFIAELHLKTWIRADGDAVSRKFSFVDLAGSEGIACTEDSPLFDKSLHVFGKVVDGIEKVDNDGLCADDCILTQLVKDSIGRNKRAILVACINERRSSIEETQKTLNFSCISTPKALQYFNATAKLIYDLKNELQVLSYQNRHLRTTVITNPTWELHALSHTTSTAADKELQDEKAVRAMHNAILKNNKTYEFKPRFGGRMYFPSNIAGHEIPLKPLKTKVILDKLKTGGHLDKSELSSLQSTSVFSEGMFDPLEAQSSIGLGSRPSSTRKSRSDNDLVSVSEYLRFHGAPGPKYFRKGDIQPLRETTRLGFDKESATTTRPDWADDMRKLLLADAHEKQSNVSQVHNGGTNQGATSTNDNTILSKSNSISVGIRPKTAPVGKNKTADNENEMKADNHPRSSPASANIRPKMDRSVSPTIKKRKQPRALPAANSENKDSENSTPHETDGVQQTQESATEPEPTIEMAFNPRKPSVFAASLFSGDNSSNLSRRMSSASTVELLAAAYSASFALEGRQNSLPVIVEPDSARKNSEPGKNGEGGEGKPSMPYMMRQESSSSVKSRPGNLSGNRRM